MEEGCDSHLMNTMWHMDLGLHTTSETMHFPCAEQLDLGTVFIYNIGLPYKNAGFDNIITKYSE